MSLINWTTYIYKLKKKHEIYHEQPNMTRLKDVEKEENMQKGMIKFNISPRFIIPIGIHFFHHLFFFHILIIISESNEDTC